MSCFKNKYSIILRNSKLVIALSIFCSSTYAQNPANELTGFECSQSKLIAIPFVKDTGTSKKAKLHCINQSVSYGQQDQFSYWYKLTIGENSTINCQIAPLNKNDKYVVYIYKYKDADFCDRMFNGKIKPVKVENEDNKKSTIEASASSDFDFTAKKGESYFFCVLTISPNNCGHKLQVITGEDTLRINAVHIPCSALDKSAPVAKTKEKVKDTVPVSKAKISYDTISIAVKDVSKGHRKVDGAIKVSDEITGKRLKIDSSQSTSARLIIEKGKKYHVDCEATGYKKFSHSMTISEYVNPDSTNFTIFMKLLKAGDNFVMNNIYFYPNTYAFTDESEDALSDLLVYLKNNPEIKIELQGHTNGNNKAKKNKAYKDKGPEWNFSGSAKALSLARAEAIKKYLVDNGVNKNNIKTVGFGGDKMIVANPKSKEALKKNVRVEIVIIDDGGL